MAHAISTLSLSNRKQKTENRKQNRNVQIFQICQLAKEMTFNIIK